MNLFITALYPFAITFLFDLQKQKLEALSKKKLPSEFLESLPSKPITQETPSKPSVNKTPEEATSPQDNLSGKLFENNLYFQTFSTRFIDLIDPC